MQYNIRQLRHRLTQTQLGSDQSVIVNLGIQSHNRLAALTYETDSVLDKTESWGADRGYFLRTTGVSKSPRDNYRLFIVYSEDGYVEGFRACYFARGTDGAATLQYTTSDIERVFEILDDIEMTERLKDYITGADIKIVPKLDSPESKATIMTHLDQHEPGKVYPDNGVSVFTPDILDWAKENKLAILEALMLEDGSVKHDEDGTPVKVLSNKLLVSPSNVPYTFSGPGIIYEFSPIYEDGRLPALDQHGTHLTVSAIGLSERDLKLFFKENQLQRLDVPYFQLYKVLENLSNSIRTGEIIPFSCKH